MYTFIGIHLFMVLMMLEPSSRSSYVLLKLIGSIKHKAPPRSPHPHQILSYITHVRTTVSGSIEFMRAVMKPVGRFGAAFPPLAPQANQILEECVRSGGPIVGGGRPRDEALFLEAKAARDELAMRVKQEEGS